MVTAESCRYREGTRLGRVGDGGKPLAVGIRVPPGTSLGPATLHLAGRQEQAPAQRNAGELRWGLWGEQPSWSWRAASPAPTVAAHLLHPLWMLGARPLLGASSDAFFPPRGHQPPRSTALGKSIPAGPASPRQESLISLQCCGRALCDGWVSCWGPGHLSPLASRLSPGPCDHPALHRHKPVVGPVSQTRLR